MKIAYVCSDVDVPVFGSEGCSIHVRSVIQALAHRGHEIEVLCASKGEGDTGDLPAQVIQVEPHGAAHEAWEGVRLEPVVLDMHLERDVGSVLFNHWLIDEGGRRFELDRPDVIYERSSLFGWAGTELARRFGIPLIMEVNAPLSQQQEGYKRFTLPGTARALERSTLRSADALIALTDWLRRWLMGLGVEEERIHVIPSGIPEWLFERPPSGEQVRQSLGLSGKRIVGYVGSFQPWHDLGGLLVAFGELAGREPDLHLVLVGKGPKRRAIEARVEELGLEARVTFTGNVPHDLVPEYLAAMDISVVPWKPDEDFFFSPMKLFESMAAGTATIAAALGDIPRVVAHGSNGLLYDPSDPSSLRAALAELISKPGLQAELAEAARITASGYTWGGVAEKVEELARSLIRRHPLPQRTGGP